MLLSIVTGTYNRIHHLKRMIDSVRGSLGRGIIYEIVLVDGGSSDGTIAWAKSQPDVVLIEQGKLLGAVKAFNAGAMVARGDYVILANDDIEFLGYSLQAAISYMQDNPDVGIGAFYQDRDWARMYVDTMPAVVDGCQGRANYGQVCIVPKYLGDRVGWWGDYLHTYGGDNELSCNILELGFKIEPVPCSGIHDMKVSDNLRERNEQHPDSKLFYKKWTHSDGLVGPVLRPYTGRSELPRYRRVFYAPIYEMPHNIQYDSKSGLRSALSRIGVVQEYDWMNNNLETMLDVACAFDADLFVMQVHDARRINASYMRRLRNNHPNAVLVNWNGDYHPEILFNTAYMELLRTFNYCGFVTEAVGEKYKDAKINHFYWQIGYEDADCNPGRNTPKHDVLFLGNCYSRARELLGDALISTGVNIGLYGIWPGRYNSKGSNLYDFSSGAKLYASCKIAVGDSQWPHASGFVSNRLFQAMAAGAFMLHQRFDGMERLLGLVDGEHVVTWKDLAELKELIRYWLRPSMDKERRAIARRGQQYVLKHHSFDMRVSELMRRIGWNA